MDPFINAWYPQEIATWALCKATGVDCSFPSHWLHLGRPLSEPLPHTIFRNPADQALRWMIQANSLRLLQQRRRPHYQKMGMIQETIDQHPRSKPFIEEGIKFINSAGMLGGILNRIQQRHISADWVAIRLGEHFSESDPLYWDGSLIREMESLEPIQDLGPDEGAKLLILGLILHSAGNRNVSSICNEMAPFATFRTIETESENLSCRRLRIYESPGLSKPKVLKPAILAEMGRRRIVVRTSLVALAPLRELGASSFDTLGDGLSQDALNSGCQGSWSELPYPLRVALLARWTGLQSSCLRDLIPASAVPSSQNAGAEALQNQFQPGVEPILRKEPTIGLDEMQAAVEQLNSEGQLILNEPLLHYRTVERLAPASTEHAMTLISFANAVVKVWNQATLDQDYLKIILKIWQLTNNQAETIGIQFRPYSLEKPCRPETGSKIGSDETRYVFHEKIPAQELFLETIGWSHGDRAQAPVFSISLGPKKKTLIHLLQLVLDAGEIAGPFSEVLEQWNVMQGTGNLATVHSTSLLNALYGLKDKWFLKNGSEFQMVEKALDGALWDHCAIKFDQPEVNVSLTSLVNRPQVTNINQGNHYNVVRVVKPGLMDHNGRVLLAAQVEVD